MYNGKMSIKEKNVCRLCLNVAEHEFKINEVTREMFDVLALNLKLCISENPIMCQDCAKIVRKSFYFKLVCSNSGKRIKSFAIDIREAKLRLSDIYSDKIHLRTISDGFGICHLCTALIKGTSFVSLNILMNEAAFAEMLPVFAPETDFTVVKDPLICTSCKNDLECYFNFLQRCTTIEEKINIYCETNDSVPVKLSDMKEILFKSNAEPFEKCTQIQVIKQEADTVVKTENDYPEVCNEVIKIEEPLEIKDEDENIRETCTTPPEVTINKYHNGYSHKHSRQNSCMQLDPDLERSECKSNVNIYEPKLKTNIKVKRNKDLKKYKYIYNANFKVRPYRCASCSYKTNDKSNLRHHMVTHKDPSELKMYECTVCPFETKYKKSLQIHMFNKHECKDGPKRYAVEHKVVPDKSDKVKALVACHMQNPRKAPLILNYYI